METSNGGARGARVTRVTALAVAIVLLALTDALIALRRDWGTRLAEHFSAYHLKAYIARAGSDRSAVLVLGDSVLWGYGVAPGDTAAAQLQRRFADVRVVNGAYEAGTPINVDFLLRYALARGIAPRAVIFDLNPISFNQFAKSYDTLNAAVQTLAVPALLQPFDSNRLRADPLVEHPPLWSRVDTFLELHWALYGTRVDIHQALFGDADAVTALQSHLGEYATAPPPADRNEIGPQTPYAQMYDLTPLAEQNVSYAYTQHLLALLAAHRIAAIAVLTPTNHSLLHEYIDVPAYDENLRRLADLCRRNGAVVLNLDRAIPPREFIDNTHLTPAGNRALADAIAPALARALRVL